MDQEPLENSTASTPQALSDPPSPAAVEAPPAPLDDASEAPSEPSPPAACAAPAPPAEEPSSEPERPRKSGFVNSKLLGDGLENQLEPKIHQEKTIKLKLKGIKFN